ncbi:phage tail protein [Tardiphaga sp. 42S5]|uniref:phage tail protein n=1 Tax=Tardiphaga sp. 42S5 TaxID=1404799 RepID=UPI002A59D68F|nr:phage tail protein [Tardiphaga sp. 42S5]WPO42528.1 phage tail protein [Tardiphaga sp. 42S5]
MADTFTPNLDLTLPEIGASDDTWGDKLNDNADILDALFGAEGEGTAVVRDANNDALVSGVNITRAAGNARTVKLKSGALARWDFGADATAEAGGNVGSLFKINRYDDLGALLGTPFQIDRATGLATFASTPKVGVNDVLHMGNLGNIPIPVGATLAWDVDMLPSGYIWKNGVAASRTAWPLLFAVYGTKFGAGDGVTTFGIPNWCEVVPIGKSGMGGVAARGLITHLTLIDTAAAPVGEALHPLTAAETGPHTHSGTTGGMNANNPHTHGVGGGSIGGTSTFPVGGPTDRPVPIAPAVISISPTDINHGHDFSTNSGNGVAGAGHNNIPPAVPCGWIIKAAA